MLSVIVKRGWVAVLLVAVLLMAAVAVAQPTGDQLESFEATLAELEESDQSGIAAEEIELARTWLAEARQAQERRDDRMVEYRVRRVDHSLDLIRALVQVGNLRAGAAVQDERYETMTQEIETLSSEIEELEERKARREAELRRVRGEN